MTSSNQRFHGYDNWEDLRFPATGINPPGAVSDPGRDTSDGCFVFDAAGTELITGVAQMPHSWYEGTEVRPHIHWAPTSAAAGNVYWRFEYKVVDTHGAIPADYTVLNEVVSANGVVNSICAFDAISMTGKQVSCLILWKLSRIGGNSSDTYGADAKLYELDFHYLVDSLGSEQEYEKRTPEDKR